MPIGGFEREILRAIAANRHPDSFVAGATVLLQSSDAPRSSKDVDMLHDVAAALAAFVQADTEALRKTPRLVERHSEFTA